MASIPELTHYSNIPSLARVPALIRYSDLPPHTRVPALIPLNLVITPAIQEVFLAREDRESLAGRARSLTPALETPSEAVSGRASPAASYTSEEREENTPEERERKLYSLIDNMLGTKSPWNSAKETKLLVSEKMKGTTWERIAELVNVERKKRVERLATPISCLEKWKSLNRLIKKETPKVAVSETESLATISLEEFKAFIVTLIPGTKGAQWNQRELVVLREERKKHGPRVSSWENIALAVNQTKKSAQEFVTAEQCRTKWRDMQNLYKEFLDS